MPRPPTPWFPFYAAEWLRDEKIAELNYEERGMLMSIWAKMWDNSVQRGYLLTAPNVPMSDRAISKFLGVKLPKTLKLTQRLLQLGIIKQDLNKVYFSERLAKIRTRYDLKNNNPEIRRQYSTDTPPKRIRELENYKLKKETTPSAVQLSTSSQQKEKPWDTLKRKWKEYFSEDISNKQIGKLVGKKGIYGFLFVEAIIQAVDECHKQVKDNPYGFFLAIAKEGARVEPFIRRARQKFKTEQDKIGYEDFQIPKKEV